MKREAEFYDETCQSAGVQEAQRHKVRSYTRAEAGEKPQAGMDFLGLRRMRGQSLAHAMQ